MVMGNEEIYVLHLATKRGLLTAEEFLWLFRGIYSWLVLREFFMAIVLVDNFFVVAHKFIAVAQKKFPISATRSKRV